jgi:ubiquinone/menaquinone biosynthesis C-methylase UbiE
MFMLAKRLIKPLVSRAILPFLLQERENIVSNPHIVSNPYIAAKFFPLQGSNSYHIVLKSSNTPSPSLKESLPVPPKELWWGYGDTEEEYLSQGRRDTSTMLEVLKKAGASPETFDRVLDLGCAAGRMLRFYPHSSDKSELWGTDVDASYISWCQQHLSPPFLFFTTTTSPHLPFEDNYFDLIYCGSVFTHISDLADAWLLELRRVLRKGGYAYITIHDKTTMELMLTRSWKSKATVEAVDTVKRFAEKTSIRAKDYAWFSFEQDPNSQVFYDTQYLVEKWSRFAKVVSVTPEAYGYQTAILLQK